MQKITIVIPIYNEEKNLPRIIKRLRKYWFFEYLDILFVYDESEDKTLQVAKDLSEKNKPVNIIENPYPKGFGWSIKAGVKQAQTEFVTIMMADLCDDPETIPEMYNKIKEGYDVVCGSRFGEGGEKIGGPPSKTCFSKLIGYSLHYITGLPTIDCANAFKMYRKEVIQNIPIKGNLSFAISMQMVLSSYFQGYQITETPTTWQSRERGKSQFQISDLAPAYFRTYLWGIKKFLGNT